MTEQEKNALLPAGLRDVLPPDAAFEADIVERLVAVFAARGYDRIKPPLIEFEEGLLSGAGVAVAPQTFRLMDPVSQRMMGVRADITPQIARIARTRLGDAPRPLRLSYAGDVLRVRGGQLRPERQIVQVGAELVGSPAPAADAEVISMAVEALEAIGIGALSVDLTVPRMVSAILAEFGISGDQAEALRAALDRKDPAGVAAQGGAAAPVLDGLLAATGPVEAALAKLDDIELPDLAARERRRVGEVVALLRTNMPAIRLTLDPVEHRGFEYHTGIGFTIFSGDASAELASGGRYRARNGDSDVEGERATGVTLYVDTALGIAAPATVRRRVLLPAGTSGSDAANLRDSGWVTVAALESDGDPSGEARRLGCTHLLGPDGPVAV